MDLEEWEDDLPFFDDALVVLAETPGGDSPEMVHYPTLPYPTLPAQALCSPSCVTLGPTLSILSILCLLFFFFHPSSLLPSPPLHFPSSLSCLVLSCQAECHNLIGSTLQALGVPEEAKEAFTESLR